MDMPIISRKKQPVMKLETKSATHPSMFRLKISALDTVIPFFFFFFFLFTVDDVQGYTVRQCSTEDSTNSSGVSGGSCCHCPQVAQHWATYHCDASSYAFAVAWPAPYSSKSGGCKVPVVRTCTIHGENTPVIYTPKDIDLRQDALGVAYHPGNHTYHLLAREYAVALLNTAPTVARRRSCVDYNVATESTLTITTQAGRQQETHLKNDVMSRASVLLTLHCATRSFETLQTRSEKQEVEWLTSLLRGFNSGTMFTKGTACPYGGDPGASYGTDWSGLDSNQCTIDAASDSSTCTLSPSGWLELACDPTNPNKKNCPRWPGSTFESPSAREETFLCGERETFVDILANASYAVDPWLSLATQYVAATLNVQSGSCYTGTVSDALAKAYVLLMSNCPCSDPLLLGQQGCYHDVEGAYSAAKYYATLDNILSDYNLGITGPGTCLNSVHHLHHGQSNENNHNQNEKTPNMETALEYATDNSFCCTGGCTRSYAYYLGHSCHSWQLDERQRIAWPGGNDADCTSLPNVEDDPSLCGYSYYNILQEYTTERGIDEQDAWIMLAQATIVAMLNENAGACTENALTRFSDPSEPWNRVTISQVIGIAREMLTSHCNNMGNVGFDTPLGIEMHAIRTVLDDFIRGVYGPGQCFPDATQDASCNNIRVFRPFDDDYDNNAAQQLKEEYKNALTTGISHVSATGNAGGGGGNNNNNNNHHAVAFLTNGGDTSQTVCNVRVEPSCCVKTADYWAMHNVDEPRQRRVHWPILVPTMGCNFIQDVCYNMIPNAHLDTFARDLAQVLRVDPMRLAYEIPDTSSPGGTVGIQEHTSYCPSNVSGTFFNRERATDTQMIRLLRIAKSNKAMRGYTVDQIKWIRLANAFTVAMLNIRNITDGGNCDRTVDGMMRAVAENDPYGYMHQSDFLQQCLFGACDSSNPLDTVPSFPQNIPLCKAGYFPVVNGLEAFSNGHTESGGSGGGGEIHPWFPKGVKKFPHCSVAEPPSARCDVGGNDGRYCSCVKNRNYYQSHYQGHELPEFRVSWPRIVTAPGDGSTSISSTSAAATGQSDALYFPDDLVSAGRQQTGAGNTEDFTGLTCPTGYGVGDTTWFDIMTEQSGSHNEDAYSVLMVQLIPAWLNVFAGACPPADVVEILEDVTHMVDAMVTASRETNVLCSSNALGTRIPIGPASEYGVKMMSAARVLRSFNEGYQGSEACVDLCHGPDAADCGSHGLCMPSTGECVCDDGYTGDTCSYSLCSGHGAYINGRCVCFAGWGGPMCGQCGNPRTARGHVYICMPCAENVCGGPGQYLLDHVEATNATALLTGDKKLRGYEELPFPLRPGTNSLDCACNNPAQVSEVIQSVTGGGHDNRPDWWMSKRVNPSTRNALRANRDRVTADFFTANQARLRKREQRALVAEGEASRINKHLRSQPLDPYHVATLGLTPRSVVTTRSICDTPSEEATVESFLILCMEDLTNLQDSLEETTSMCELSVELCESAIEENTAITHTDLYNQQEDDNNTERWLSISTLAIAATILFVLAIVMLIILFIWAGVRVRNTRARGRLTGRVPATRSSPSQAGSVPPGSLYHSRQAGGGGIVHSPWQSGR